MVTLRFSMQVPEVPNFDKILILPGEPESFVQFAVKSRYIL